MPPAWPVLRRTVGRGVWRAGTQWAGAPARRRRHHHGWPHYGLGASRQGRRVAQVGCPAYTCSYPGDSARQATWKARAKRMSARVPRVRVHCAAPGTVFVKCQAVYNGYHVCQQPSRPSLETFKDVITDHAWLLQVLAVSRRLTSDVNGQCLAGVLLPDSPSGAAARPDAASPPCKRSVSAASISSCDTDSSAACVPCRNGRTSAE
jgi:hypothetical protein